MEAFLTDLLYGGKIPGPGARGEVKGPEVIEGGGGRGAAPEDVHGHAGRVVHRRVRVPLADVPCNQQSSVNNNQIEICHLVATDRCT